MFWFLRQQNCHYFIDQQNRYTDAFLEGREAWPILLFFQFYDRVGKHTYQPRPEDKSGADTSSESEDDRSRRQ